MHDAFIIAVMENIDHHFMLYGRNSKTKSHQSYFLFLTSI